MMKTIVVQVGEVQREFAVNANGTGLFVRQRDGGLSQCLGTTAFRARTPAEMARKIRAELFGWESARLVAGSARNW